MVLGETGRAPAFNWTESRKPKRDKETPGAPRESVKLWGSIPPNTQTEAQHWTSLPPSRDYTSHQPWR